MSKEIYNKGANKSFLKKNEAKLSDFKFAKNYELDKIRQIDKLAEEFNRDPENHYQLKIIKGLRRAWF